MKKILCTLIFLPFFFLISCVTPAKTQESEQLPPAQAQTPEVQPTQETQPAVPEQDTVVAQFDKVTITKQTFEHTKTEMQLVVEQLNKITYARDYQSWLGWLSDEYYQTYSDPKVLETVSASLPTKGIKLKNLKDYFNYVFVPSRQNMRVDTIQFVSPTRVYVIMEIMPNSPAAIYILEKTQAGWKLVPKNLQ
jgi:hypothetical protein